jgi:hypothetical protein
VSTNVPRDLAQPRPLARAPQRMAHLAVGQQMPAAVTENERSTQVPM